jgi:hypothetical protein
MNEGATQQQQQAKLGKYLLILIHFNKIIFSNLDSQLCDQYRLRSHTYIDPPYYQSRTTSLTSTTATTTTSSTSSLSTDVSSNTAWPFVGCPRPTSNSFSEVLNQQQQLRVNNNLSASYGGSPSFYSLQQQNQTRFLPDINFPPQQTTNCTLYSLNQPSNDAISPPPSGLARKRTSLVGFPVEEIKGKSKQRKCNTHF